MTKNKATQFDHTSLTSEMMIAEHFECGCEAYKDVFTYRRWKAQGKQVQKGQKGFKLQVFVKKEWEDKEGNKNWKTYPKTTTVFCRCQVK